MKTLHFTQTLPTSWRKEPHNKRKATKKKCINEKGTRKLKEKKRRTYNCQRLDFFFSGRDGFSFEALKKEKRLNLILWHLHSYLNPLTAQLCFSILLISCVCISCVLALFSTNSENRVTNVNKCLLCRLKTGVNTVSAKSPDHLCPSDSFLQLHQPLLILVPLHQDSGHLHPGEALPLGCRHVTLQVRRCVRPVAQHI